MTGNHSCGSMPRKMVCYSETYTLVYRYCFFVIFTSKIGDLYAKNTT